MRLTHLGKLAALAEPMAHPLELAGPRGERFRVTVLDHDRVRVQHWPDGAPRLDRTWIVSGTGGDVPRDGRLREDLSPFVLPAFEVERDEARLQVITSRLRVVIETAHAKIEWATADGRVFAGDLAGRAYSYNRAGREIIHAMARRAGEHYYGFGERAGPLDKAGRRMRMLNLDALGYNAEHSDPLYKHFPFYITFVPALDVAYGLLYDNLATSVFDMGKEIDNYYGPYRTYTAEDGDLDYTLIFGPTIPEVVRKLARLTGLPALPPRWSLGYLGSTMTYTEAPDAQDQLRQFAELCHRHDISCDLFHLSSGYTTGDDGRRNVFHWNTNRVPDPPGMAEDFHNAGIRLAANIKPCLLTSHPRYREVAEAGGFVRGAGTDAPELNQFWGGEGSHIDFTAEAGFGWWQASVQRALLDVGIDATWNDNNEFEIWDDEARCAAGPIGLLRPVQTLLMVRASYDAQRAHMPDRRPYVLSRSGCPGIQRYAQTWSGDNLTSWQTLRYNIPMGLGLSLSGAPNTGHDVGGFAGPRPDPELFVRWVQNGIFHPRFCIHSWNDDGSASEPWMYPDMLPLVRAAIEFRYRLIPYLYTLLFRAAETGEPIIRPMVYEFPAEARTHTESFDFMLGPWLLVASVLERGARQRTVYLPRGVTWSDFYTGARYEGGQSVTLDAPLERTPLLVREGGLIPLGKVMRYVGEQEDDIRQVLAFPQAERGESACTIVEDDGISFGYQRGELTTVTPRLTATPHQLHLACEVSGSYELPYREFELVLPPGEQRPVKGEGVRAGQLDAAGRRHWTLPLSG